MPTLDEKNPTYAPAYVVGIYPKLSRRARKLGYALTLHGSLQRDMDVLAIPWTEDACEPLELVKALADVFNLEPNHDITKPTEKPHGRLVWTLPLWWGAFIDLGVMPRSF